MEKKFTKNDCGFICKQCGTKVSPLGYTSRDHCPKCLTSLHVDINPGDRQNPCMGLLIPIGVENTSKKGYVITYRCSLCNKTLKNKAAEDDSFDAMIAVMKNKYQEYLNSLN